MEKKERSPRNKTIVLSPEDEALYLSRCLPPGSPFAPDTVINGDCIEALASLPDGFAGLLIADPPYNLDKAYAGARFSRMKDADYLAFTERWLDAVLPKLKPDASVYVCCDWRSGMIIGPALEERLCLRGRITWQREKGRGAEKNWKNSCEDIWFCTVSDDYYFDRDAVRQRRRVIAPYRENGKPKDWSETPDGRFRDTCPSNFWDDISVPYWSMAENTEHPTQKPEKLLAKLILASSREGDIILDPFAGSGSTAAAAKKLGRRFLCIEQSGRYCALAQKRIELAETDKRIQGFSDGVFWERNSEPKVR